MMNTRFRRRPVEIEAVRVLDAIHFWAKHESMPDAPEWLAQAVKQGQVVLGLNHCYLVSLEGQTEGAPDHWIVRDAGGELSLCAGAIFEKTYEPVT
jgi:hypothetical protein